jgi:hypothetical protein
MDEILTPFDMRTCLLKTDRTSNDTRVSSIVSFLDNEHFFGQFKRNWLVAYPDAQFDKDAVIIKVRDRYDDLPDWPEALVALLSYDLHRVVPNFDLNWIKSMQSRFPARMVKGPNPNEEYDLFYDTEFPIPNRREDLALPETFSSVTFSTIRLSSDLMKVEGFPNPNEK